jgi:hypothetical protein
MNGGTMFKSIATFGALVLLGFVSTIALAADSDAGPKPDKDGFIELFNGKNLDGWKVGANAGTFSVKDGQIIVHGTGPAHLFYVGPVHNHDWKNFHLRVELETFPHANSGVYFHTQYQESSWPDKGFECQVNATHSDWKKTGSLYDIKDIRDPHHKDNEWFVYDIIVKDQHVELKINGQTVNEWTQPANFKPAAGHAERVIAHGTFALQGHDPGSEVHYRSVKVKAPD